LLKHISKPSGLKPLHVTLQLVISYKW